MQLIEKIFLASLILGYAVEAISGPPFITDDPEPVAYQHWEANYALTGTQTSGGSQAFLPQADINYGVLPGVQLHVQPQLAYFQHAGMQAFGVGDTELGLKYRLTPADAPEEDWIVGVYPLVEVPSGRADRNLGVGTWREYVPLWVQTKRGPWIVYGGGGYWFNGGALGRNAWAGGAVTLYQVTPVLQLGGEYYFRTADTVGGHSASSFNLGGTKTLAKDYALLFSVGRGLTQVTTVNEASFYVGLQVLY